MINVVKSPVDMKAVERKGLLGLCSVYYTSDS